MIDNDIVEGLNEDVESDIRNVDYQGLTIAGLDFSAGTLASQITERFIDLSPAFQRRNAWNDEKRSRFIESLILHVPIPQIVLAEREPGAGTYFVLDGRQRLMTIASLYNADYRKWRRPQFDGLYDKTDLNGVALEAFATDERYLGDFQRFRTAAIRCSILSGWRSHDVLYDIFFRLNSGSVPLTGQELRQVFYTGGFANFLFAVTEKDNPIQRVLRISEPDPRFADSELILRLLAFMLGVIQYTGDMKLFLDETMRRINATWPDMTKTVEANYERIIRAFSILDTLVQLPNVGRRPIDGDRFDGHFNRALFEVQVYYFALNAIEERAAQQRSAAYRQALGDLLRDQEFKQSIEATTKSVARVQTRFQKYREMLSNVFASEFTAFPNIVERAGA